MSYQVLARKWRPQHFAGLVGQEHVKNALGNALNNNRLHHAYLFTGTRGVGKTTIARIFAKSLNCEQGVTATPCGQCSACLEIDAGNFVDLLEIDAASRTKVEDTRDLLDNVQYAPSRGRYKVYLIDEVHMLSKHSFNALLKTLEEPPPHVKFLLATTDPQKLPVTVLSRCLQFNLLALSPVQIEQHLAYVLAEEAIPFQATALSMLAKAAKGSLRDALSLTDQAIAQSNANISEDSVRSMLGLLDQSWAQQLLQAIVSQDAMALQQTLQALIQQQSNFTQVLDDMLSLLHLAALSQFSQAAAAFSPQHSFVTYLAEQIAPAQLQLYYQLLISGKKELPYAPDPLTGLEMALLRAMAFVPEARQSTNVTAATLPSVVLAPVKPSVATSEPATVKASAPVVPETTVSETAQQPGVDAEPVMPVAPQATTEVEANLSVAPTSGDTAPASHIDPVTARIMARRGVQVTAPTEKKSERPQAQPAIAPTDTAVNQPPPIVTPKPAVAETVQIPASRSDIQPEQFEHAPVESALFNSPPADDVDEPELLNYDGAMADALWQQYEQDMQRSTNSAAETAVQLENFDGSINEQNFSIRFAAQVDAWAARVETLDTGGLSRLFLLNAAMQLQDGRLSLTVAQSQQHLDSPSFRSKLQQVLEQSFSQPLSIEITYQAEVAQSPLSIQQKIVQERFSYVSKLLHEDEKVQQLQTLFDAELIADSIVVN
ncbi:MAG TPA: DNA polymerase III subunit gamma/tau [Rheinheimera sp.]|nr:DNA polymerase III subunit gamma/tau [Rheinheimera sp.]